MYCTGEEANENTSSHRQVTAGETKACKKEHDVHEQKDKEVEFPQPTRSTLPYQQTLLLSPQTVIAVDYTLVFLRIAFTTVSVK
ncbi:hypothetical protein E2C01_037445 [Portunus trituberculatus]|uniref:Uncharacterized protein n=1 Tax=Portunus trituberculatus TaxID=210409 RepID=A0A5B7FBF6_PORTR|nr:hypothetical protein [Portunus trituberculatus]